MSGDSGADRRIVVSREEYDRIQAELDEPPEMLPRLAALLAEASRFDQRADRAPGADQ